MFNLDSTPLNDTSLFGQSTPVNLHRTEGSFLFGNTSTTPFLSSNLRGTTNIPKTSQVETTTFHKYVSTGGLDKANKNLMQTSYHTKLSNDFGSDTLKDNQKNASTIIPTSTPTTSSRLTSFLFDNKSSTKPITALPLENNQPSTSTFTPGTSSFVPLATTANLSFNFSLSKKPVITSSTNTTPIPVLFSTMNQATTSSVDLQSFRTMLNTQPFDNESAFLARHTKTNITHDEARLRSTLNTSTSPPKTHLFSSMLRKPIVLSSNTKSNKRKLVDSFIDNDNDNNSSIFDDGPCSTFKIPKLTIKRPRLLDMNKIRSIVLGTHEPSSETIFDKSLSSSSLISDKAIGWKKFPTYEEYMSSKNRDRKQEQQLVRLPKLTHKDYYTKPTIEELRSSCNENGQCFVKEFTIGRKHYGSVTFRGLHMNLAGLDLDRIVEIGRRQVTVYPNEEDRPAEGEELNCQAIISLLGVYPIDRLISNSNEEITDPDRLIDMNYGKYLEQITKKFHGEFIDYDVYTGTWSFQVEHF